MLKNVPEGYIYSENEWGKLFYKKYGQITWNQGRATCEADGVTPTRKIFLPVPHSYEENQFYS